MRHWEPGQLPKPLKLGDQSPQAVGKHVAKATLGTSDVAKVAFATPGGAKAA